MSFKDIIKSGVLKSLGEGGNLELPDIFLILLMAAIIGVYIYIIYKSTTRSTFYSRDLNITMAGMTIVVAAIMIAMQSNLLVSLGMVGALSIVRFRTAVKNPIDLLYLFWAISGGIICGVGLHALAVVMCFIMTLLVIILERIPNSRAPMLLIVRGETTIDTTKIESVVSRYSKRFRLCTSTIKDGQSELIFEVNTEKKAELVSGVGTVSGIFSVSCLEHDGEIRA